MDAGGSRQKCAARARGGVSPSHVRPDRVSILYLCRLSRGDRCAPRHARELTHGMNYMRTWLKKCDLTTPRLVNDEPNVPR